MHAADPHAPPFWRDERRLAVAVQVLFVVAVVVALLAVNAALEASFRCQNIRLDWGFFRQSAGFQLSALTWTVDLETLRFKPYDPGDSAGEAMIAGLLNTIRVAALGIVLATLLGVFVGVIRLSRNWLVNRLALGYVQVLRNTPLLVSARRPGSVRLSHHRVLCV